MNFSYRSIYPIVIFLSDDYNYITYFNCETKETGVLSGKISVIKKYINNYLNIGGQLSRIDNIILNKNLFNKATLNFNSWRQLITNIDNNHITNTVFKKIIYNDLIFAISDKKIHHLDFIQAVNFPSSAITRTKWIRNNCTSNKTIALIGDDDFLSIVLKKFAQSITVFDIDKELISILNRQKIISVNHNLLNSFADYHLKEFDIVFCDPPHANNWIELFVIRAIQLCKMNGIISVASSSKDNSKVLDIAKKTGLKLLYIEKTETKYLSTTFGEMNYRTNQIYFLKEQELNIDITKFKKQLEKSEKLIVNDGK